MNSLRTPLSSTSGTNPFVAHAARAGVRCRECGFRLKREDGDDLVSALCGSCKPSPAEDALHAPSPMSPAPAPFANMIAAVTGASPVTTVAAAARRPGSTPSAPAGTIVHTADSRPRPFTDADRALIRKIGAFMSPSKLLDTLNERLACDLGPDEPPYTLDQLNASLAEIHGAANPEALGRDWPSIRKLLAQARRAGVLDQINDSVIDDFAVVFQLNAKQVVELKDIVLGAKDD
jgi:hypothetical protein